LANRGFISSAWTRLQAAVSRETKSTKAHAFRGHVSAVLDRHTCAGAQHLARRCSRFGHDVKLIAPRFVKGYLKSSKNDFNDAAAAIC
jgi:transposase